MLKKLIIIACIVVIASGGVFAYSRYKKPLETPLRVSESVVNTKCTQSDDDKVLSGINAERQRVGIAPVIMYEKFDSVADSRAVSLNGVLDNHAGMRALILSGIFSADYLSVNEILATNGCDPIKQWMASPSHKSAILDSRYSVASVGIYKDVFVVIFGDLR